MAEKKSAGNKDGSSGRGSSRSLLNPWTWGDAGEGATGRVYDRHDDRLITDRRALDGSSSLFHNFDRGDTPKYKRGGFVGARASGKRMYAKGGMVKGKCGG